ncbi:MAG TPA: D-glycero-beta-D-manno-heptose 1-phosphate adenylyltransferase, partial [Ktedonobacter sp.]|nr:D-glycero-beta-D-manno-heptose 1-phosphate adenylyltransferase [Ktedonobacter sp.]
MSTAIELVQRFREVRVLVIGDAMLDTYLEGNAARLCSEGPVPVIHRTEEHRFPGGAANTATNLRALDADVCFLGLVGNDTAAMQLRTALRERDIADDWLIEDETITTLHKLRILADGQYVVRFDEGGDDIPSTTSVHKLLDALEAQYAHCDVVVISDYRYGVLCDAVIERLHNLHTANPKPLLIDSKALHRFHDIEATVVTPNLLEAQLLTNITLPETNTITSKHVLPIAQRLLTMLKTQHVAVTLGAQGVFLLDRSGKMTHLPAYPVAHANDVGAGDSFASAMALALASGGNIVEAAQIGIDAAGIAVTRLRTSAVQYQELLQRVSLREFASQNAAKHPETRQETWMQLASHLAVERMTGRSVVFTNGVFDILHAGHVQFLRQAKALGGNDGVLVVGINSDASVRRMKGAGRPINNERDRMALVAALDAVDFVVLFDEDTPTELIRALRPSLHVKGGDYAGESLPEAEAVREGGGQVVILPLAGAMSTSAVIERIASLAQQSGNQGENGVHTGDHKG